MVDEQRCGGRCEREVRHQRRAVRGDADNLGTGDQVRAEVGSVDVLGMTRKNDDDVMLAGSAPSESSLKREDTVVLGERVLEDASWP